MKPMPGSCRSRAIMVLTSARIWSATRSGRDPCPIAASSYQLPAKAGSYWELAAGSWELFQEFYFRSRDQSRLEPLDLVDDGGELLVRVPLVVRHGDDAEGAALPEVLVIDLGEGHVELLDAILDTPQHHPLVFQRSGARDVELDREETDDNHESFQLSVVSFQLRQTENGKLITRPRRQFFQQ